MFNGSRFLESALSSILGQSRPVDELIVVDDGSTDDSLDVVTAAVGDRSPIPVKLLVQPHRGQASARNEGAAVASGAFLAFCDQDDVWAHDHVSSLLRALEEERPDVGWAFADFDEIDADGKVVCQRVLEATGRTEARLSICQFLAEDLMMIPSTVVVRATAFRSVGGFDAELRGYEDDDLFIRLFRAGWRAEQVRESLTAFRVHPASATFTPAFRQSRVAFLEKLLVGVPEQPELGRHYVRDIAAPRLFQSTVREYAAALRAGDDELARGIAVTLGELEQRFPTGLRRQLGVRILRHPTRVRALLRMCATLPRLLRPEMHDGLLAAGRCGRG